MREQTQAQHARVNLADDHSNPALIKQSQDRALSMTCYNINKRSLTALSLNNGIYTTMRIVIFIVTLIILTASPLYSLNRVLENRVVRHVTCPDKKDFTIEYLRYSIRGYGGPVIDTKVQITIFHKGKNVNRFFESNTSPQIIDFILEMTKNTVCRNTENYTQ